MIAAEQSNAEPMTLAIALYSSLTDTRPEITELSWPAVVELLTSSRDVREQKDGPLISFARLAPRKLSNGETVPATRRNECVSEITALALDFDEWPAGMGINDAIEKLNALQLAYVAHTSHSHLVPWIEINKETGEQTEMPGVEKLRVVLPLAQPILSRDYKSGVGADARAVAAVDPRLDANGSEHRFLFAELPAGVRRQRARVGRRGGAAGFAGARHQIDESVGARASADKL